MPAFQFGRGERWALVSAFAYAAVGVMLRAAAPTMDPVLGSLLRQLPLMVIAIGALAITGGRELRPGAPEFLGWRFVVALAASGVLSFVVGNIMYFEALKSGGLGVTVGGVQSGSVLGGLWIGMVALRERPAREQLIGAALILAGLFQIAVAQTQDLAGLWWVGLLLALGAGTTYAIGNTVSRAVQRQRPLLFATLLVAGLGGVLPLAGIVAARAALGETIAGDVPSVISVLVAGLANALALAALALGVRAAPVATVNTISSGSIVLAFLASVLIFGESGSPPMILGITLVTAGIVVAQVRRRARSGDGAAQDAGTEASAATPPAAGT
ncbi:MAG TPA: DMT family transporter [Solirubrobacterales bacterium]|nr:DMT family transporter [Solirubrobacterales bacterium]